jgi:hypothetical protein
MLTKLFQVIAGFLSESAVVSLSELRSSISGDHQSEAHVAGLFRLAELLNRSRETTLRSQLRP